MRIIAVAAISINGKITSGSHFLSNWTSRDDKIFLRSMLNKCDVIIIGNNTYKAAQKNLSKRNCIVLTRSLRKTNKKTDNQVYCNPKKGELLGLINKHKTAVILGGAQTYTYCLENGLLNELYLTIEPIIFGRGLDIFKSKTIEMMRFKLVSIKKLNESGSILLHYKK